MSAFNEKQKVCSEGETALPNRGVTSNVCGMIHVLYVSELWPAQRGGMLTNTVIVHQFAFSVEMLGSTLQVIKGVSSLRVSSQRRPNVDDFSWFVCTKKKKLILTWMVLLDDIFSFHCLCSYHHFNYGILIVIFSSYLFFPESLFQQSSVLKEKKISKASLNLQTLNTYGNGELVIVFTLNSRLLQPHLEMISGIMMLAIEESIYRNKSRC